MSNAALALCRVCLASDINMYYIANTRYQEIFEKLSTQLCTEDRRPETVCYICLSQLQRCSRFMSMSQKAEAILTQISLSDSQTSNENVNKLNLNMQPLSVAPMQNLFNGDSDDSSQATVNRQVIFVEEEATPDEDPFVEVEINNFVTSEMVCVKIEVESDHDALDESTMDMEQPNLQTRYCCNVCSNIFSDAGQLALHMKLAHAAQEAFTCYMCKKQFNKKYSLTRHMRVHTGEKRHACNICGKHFLQKSHLTRHLKIHTGEKPKPDPTKLVPPPTIACDLCDKLFYHQSHLIRHMRVHTGEKPYICDVCNKQFNRKSILTLHMRVHTGEMPFACSVCDKRFNVKSNLTSHMIVHTGEKPFACTICKKSFNKKYNLSIHMAVHNE